VGHPTADIIADLERVRALRQARSADASLDARTASIKAYQHQRFAHDYGTLLVDPRYKPAARFFLDELYGPADFAKRDAEFARVVPTMSRLLPREVMQTVSQLSALHALTEGLDHEMAKALSGEVVDAESYRRAWSLVGRRAERERQLALLLAIGRSLDGYARQPLLASTLRLMRGPANAAGLGHLQSFLEAGLRAFTQIGESQVFFATIADNEQRVIDTHFGRSKE
jgi:hypothetical protein